MRRIGALGLAAFLGGSAWGTWSILIVDVRTGEVALASATCLTGFDLEANTPVLLPLIGGATAQSFVDSDGTNRTFIRDRLIAGDTPQQILVGLSLRDGGHQTRQYGIIDTTGGVATFSGTGAGQWAGGRTGRVGDLVYTVQGNVLTGQPVVDRAVQAILDTPGDIAAKLMASMEAARAMGGDGRCSCSGGNPQGCGSPPPTFTKSAHIAYMLIAREGDVQNCRAAYRVPSTPITLQLTDWNHDGKLDVAAASSGTGGGLALIANVSTVGGPAMLGPANITPAGANTRDVVPGDFNADGRPDFALTNQTGGTVTVLLGAPGGGFSPGVAYPIGSTPVAIGARDFTGDGRADLVAANQGANTITVLVNNGDGTFGAPNAYATDFGPISLAIADADADGDLDVFTANQTARTVSRLINAGNGTFTSAAVLTLLSAPGHVLAADLTGDARADLVTCASAENAVRIHVAVGASYASSSVSASTGVAQAALGNANRDEFPDLFVRAGTRHVILRGLGGALFEGAGVYLNGFTASRTVVGDLDQDGDDDIAYTTGGGNAIVVMSNLSPVGTNSVDFGEAGCASGGGFMDFNVANRAASDPDPVFTLRDMYTQWRTALIGTPDAVRSTGVLARAYLPGDGHSTSELIVDLTDWQGGTANADWSVRAESGGLLRVSDFTPMGQGRFRAVVTAGLGCGTGEIVVRAVRGAGGSAPSVVLTPHVHLSLGAPGDFDADGSVDFFDYDAFVGALESGNLTADVNADGVLDFWDYDLFVQQFLGGC